MILPASPGDPGHGAWTWRGWGIPSVMTVPNQPGTPGYPSQPFTTGQPVEQPAKNASTEDWVAYAQSREPDTAKHAQLADMSRTDLIDRYGS